MESYKREFIQFLQSAGVLKFGDFTAKSGRKIPYFINAGMIKTGDEIAKLGEFYAKAYFEKVGNKKTVLYGPAYKGISIAVSAAVALTMICLSPQARMFSTTLSMRLVFMAYSPLSGSNRSSCTPPSFIISSAKSSG